MVPMLSAYLRTKVPLEVTSSSRIIRNYFFGGYLTGACHCPFFWLDEVSNVFCNTKNGKSSAAALAQAAYDSLSNSRRCDRYASPTKI
jgi:hypothetical protein